MRNAKGKRVRIDPHPLFLGETREIREIMIHEGTRRAERRLLFFVHLRVPSWIMKILKSL
jgi:hypothetical protein